MSLRLRVALGMAFIALVLVGFAARTVRTTKADMIAQVDAVLVRSAPRLRVAGQGIERPGASPLWVGVIARDQLRPVLVPGLTRSDPGQPDLTPDRARAALGSPPFTVDATGSDMRYRVYVTRDARAGRTVVYAAPLEDVDEAVRKVRNNQLVGLGVVISTLGVVAFWVLRLGISPIRQMTATATAIAEGDRSRRVPHTRPGTEAAELGDALNHMLTRIDEDVAARAASEARLRQFVADASHELRTPLATIGGYAELYRMGGLVDPDQLDDAMRRTEQEARRMAALVEDLLNLARLDQGRPLQLGPVDLVSVVGDTVRDARAVEPDRPVTYDGPAQLVVPGDEALLRQVFTNLIGNVRMHTPTGTPVHIRVRSEDGWAIVEVADEGPGMDHETAARAFERFYRSDTARTRATGGSGLGLSIVAGVVAAHHGHVAISPTAAVGGTTVSVALPIPMPGPPTMPTARPDTL